MNSSPYNEGDTNTPCLCPPAAAASRLAAHLGADGVETGDAVPAALAKELRVALQTNGP